MSFGPPNASSSTPSNQGPNKALIIKRIVGQQVQMGDAVQISGATDREAQIRLTLDRLKAEKLKQAQLEADDLIRQAQDRIDQLLQDAQAQANAVVAEGHAQKDATLEEARQQGYAAGYQAGYDDGIQASETDTHAMLLSANVLLVRAYDAQKAVLGNIAPQASKIMQALVKRVVHHQLDYLTLEQWQHWYQCSLGQLDTSSRYRLVVGTESYHRLQQFSKTLGQLVSTETTAPGFERIKLELDPHLAAHEIYIIADEGMVDVSPNTQIDQYIAAITPDVLELESVETFEINPDDEEEQLDSLSQQLETILYSPLSSIHGPVDTLALTQNTVPKSEQAMDDETFVPTSFESEMGTAIKPFDGFEADPWELEHPLPEPLEDSTPAPAPASPSAPAPAFDLLDADSLTELPDDPFAPLELGQTALPFEFPSFDAEPFSMDLDDGLGRIAPSPVEDEF